MTHLTDMTDEDITTDTGWVLVNDYKRKNTLEELTAKQWSKYCISKLNYFLYGIDKNGNKVNAAPISEATNYVDTTGADSSQYQISTVVDGKEVMTLTEVPLTSPSVVSFGKFTSSLAVVNNSTSGHIEVNNTTFNTGTLAGEANSFVSQLGAFSEFLANTDEMLTQRKRELEEQTRIKRDALTATQLQVENIRQRALQAQRDTIATVVSNQSIDATMQEVITEGKSLHATLSTLGS